MAAPALPNFAEVTRGDTQRIKLTFRLADLSPINITGWRFGMTLKEVEAATDAAAAVQVFTTAGDDDDDDPVNGVVHIMLESDDMEAVVGKKVYFYDIQRAIPRVGKAPLVKTLFAGRVSVAEDITDISGL